MVLDIGKADVPESFVHLLGNPGGVFGPACLGRREVNNGDAQVLFKAGSHAGRQLIFKGDHNFDVVNFRE